MLTEATRLDQGLGGLTKLVALLPRLADELGSWIDEEDSEIANRDRCPLEIVTLTKLIKSEDRFHKGILLKTPEFEEYSKSAQIHDQIILTITQSHQSYARTLSNARPSLCYTTEADPTATHRFQEDADKLLGQWDDLLSLSEKSLEYKQGTLAALDNVMKLYNPINDFLEEGENILLQKPKAFELENWLTSAEEFMRKKSSYEPAAATFIEECEALIASSDVSLVDTAPLQALLDEFRQRWSSLQLSLSEKQQDCKDQIDKLREEKSQIEAFCRDLNSHITQVSEMRIVLRGISLPAANQSILHKQRTTLEKSDAELKEEERRVTELLHKVGDVSANINTELDQTEMASQVQELETSLKELQLSFTASQTRILEQDAVVQPFEPQLNMLLALHRDTRAEFQARPAPALDTDLIMQEMEYKKELREKLSSNAQLFEETLETGKNILSKASIEQLQQLSESDFSLDPQIADSYEDLKQKLSSLEVDWKQLSEEIQQNEQTLSESAQLAAEGSNEISQLLGRVQSLLSSLGDKGPPGAVPSIVEEQLTDMQQQLTAVSELHTSIEALKDKLQINASSPGGVAEQLARLEHEQATLTEASNEYNDRLKEGLVLATKYADSHTDLMSWLQDKLEVMSKWEPLGLDTQLLEIQLQSLNSFKDILSSRLEERQKQESVSELCSAELRPSHETTTQQYTDLCELWQQLDVRIQQRRSSLEQMQVLSQTFEEQVKVASAKLDEYSTEISSFKPNYPTDIQAINSEITEVTAIKEKLDTLTSEELVQLSSTIDQMTALAANGEFTDQTQTVTGERDSLEKDKTSLQIFISDRLTQLQLALDLASQIKTEQDEIAVWIKSADKSLESEFVIRAVSGACVQELSKINAFHESLEEMQSRVGRLEQSGIELSKLATNTDKARLDKSIASVRAKVGTVVNKEENITANLQDAQMEAQSFESMCSDMDAYILQAKSSLDQLTTTFTSGDNTALEQLLESVKQLLLEVASKQTDMDKICEKGTVLEKKCPQDGDAISTNVANLLVRYGDLQTDVETLQRDLDEAFIRAGELRTATENLINWLKETEQELDASPPLVASVEFVEQALTKHRGMATHLATKTPTITSVLDALPSMNMPAEAEELRKLVDRVKSKTATRGDRIMRGLTELRQFESRENQLRENLESFMDQLDYSENCYGVITVVEEISIQHEALMSHLPEMEQMLDEMKENALTIRTGNLVDDQTLVEDQLSDITQLWEAVSTRAQEQNTEIYNASKTAQKLANLYTQLLNWLEPAYNELTKSAELTPNNWDNINKRVTEMEKSLDQHKDQYQEFHQIFLEIEPRAHETGLEELNEVKTCISQFWTQVESLIERRRKELEAASKGIEDLMKKLKEIAEWTDSATIEMDRKAGEPIPSSAEDLEKIEEMIVEHEKFMDDLGEWHKDLEPVNRTVKALQKTEKGKEMEELRKVVNKKMQKLWVHASERQRCLKEAKDRIIDTQIYESFDYKTWLENFKSHMAKQKMREGDIFRKADIINYTYLSKEDFITQLKNTGFTCRPQEFMLVANLFEEDKRLVNVDKFLKSFRPRIENDPRPEKEVIDEHVKIEVNKCRCEHKFRVDKKETSNGLMYQFGDNKSWRLVRILRNSVMVRVGGGWEKLELFLQKQDPCRSEKDGKHLHNRINTEIFDFTKGGATMAQISSEYHSNRDAKSKALQESHKNVSVTFHDPTLENTPIKSLTEISHIKEGSPLPEKKTSPNPISPSLKKKLNTGATATTPPPSSRIQAPSSRITSRLPHSQGATGTAEKGKSVSRNSSFKDSRPGSTPTKLGSTKSRPKQDPK